jgi:hydrogenase expression/formation protein HypE
MKNDKILLSHGSGGRLSHQLIKDVFLSVFKNSILEPLDDGAIVKVDGENIVVTTDSYVVDPIFFPGGDIGKLAVSGTINDLTVMGAIPKYLSLAFIIEEGFPVRDLQKIISSIEATSRGAGVQIVTGDTKVVNKGFMDKIFINTTGIGFLAEGFRLSRKIVPGDKIIINGTIGDHGTTIMAHREGLKMHSSLESDCAPLNGLISGLIDFGSDIHLMRDPTRGGVATVLNEVVEDSGSGITIFEDSLPVKKEVSGLCEILGLDPLYIANEGKVLIFADETAAASILQKMHSNVLGREATIIGEVGEEYPGKVVMQTRYGSHRIVDMLTGEQLPRIC